MPRASIIISLLLYAFITNFSFSICFHVNAGYLSSREPLFDFFHDSVNAAGYACTLVWAASHYSTDPGTSGTLFGFNDGAGYVFAYDKDGSVSVLKQYQYMAQKVSERWDFFFTFVKNGIYDVCFTNSCSNA